MLSDKEIKRRFKQEASAEPHKHYPVSALRTHGFERRQCERCQTFFWSRRSEQRVCGDAACSGGFRFIGATPARERLSYTQVWKRFAQIHERLGYSPIRRYPSVARWNPTTEFTIASIAAFQPFVVSGEVEPPANPLTIPQFCLRFSDIDNVGVTGAHYVGFVMLGEHAFIPPADYDMDAYLNDHLTWLQEGMGLPLDEVTIHEDAWAGGGNFGSCVEFFSRGLEISNQVYMRYEQTPTGRRELKINVLDMGQGQERAAWFTQASATSYDATFPKVMAHVYAHTGLEPDPEFMRRFLPLASYLNVDEVDDPDAAWRRVAEGLNMGVAALKEKVLPRAAAYSIAEHTRALLVALADRALPSNAGGGYNLRVILRRALALNEEFGWSLSLPELARLHAEELAPQMEELPSRIDDVSTILEVERRKWEENRRRTASIIRREIKKGGFDQQRLIELYDSQGVTPKEVEKMAQEEGVEVQVPERFYALVAERHTSAEQPFTTKSRSRLPLEDLPATHALYFDHYDYVCFTGVVLWSDGEHVVLDRTAFYPTSGGQLHDIGTLDEHAVADVFKQDGVIVHRLNKKATFKRGAQMTGKIDFDRRLQLAQHHTTTHIVNAAARRVLGEHIFQAGAAKSEEKARIDLTHWEIPTAEQLERIEGGANAIIAANLPIEKRFVPRNVAERLYGFNIYQGGAVPGKLLRIVDIKGVDVEACGGTHLDLTGEAQGVKLLRCTKVQDGIIRLEYVAGAAAEHMASREQDLLAEVEGLLGVERELIPGRVRELFKVWKRARKAAKKGTPLSREELTLSSQERSAGAVLEEAAAALETQPEHLPKTIKRFLSELERMKGSSR